MTNTNGLNINLFLIDGIPDGRYKCSIYGYTAVAYKVPKVMLNDCKDIECLNQSGVYFLFGKDEDDNDTVYVGQAGSRKNGKGLLLRVNEKHNRSIDEWNEVVMITTTDDSLGATEISFLENSFCNMAKEAKRYIVSNGNEPNVGNITEEKETDMLRFIQNAKIIIGALGYNLFNPVVSQRDINDGTILYFKNKDADARAIRTSDGIVVLQGSKVANRYVDSCRANVKEAIEKYRDKVNEERILIEDILIGSPSKAIGFVSGHSKSGPQEWKTKDGKTLEEIESSSNE